MKIAADNEPGQRIVITGHVLTATGKPAHVRMYAYHTDAKGLYRPDGSMQGEPRLRGTLITSPDGAYEIDTIKPAPYPHREIPAHVHVHLRGDGFVQQEEIRFDGNGPLVCHLVNNRCTVDFRLR